MPLKSENIYYHVMPGSTAEMINPSTMIKMEQMARLKDSVEYLFSIYEFNNVEERVIRVIYFKKVMSPEDVVFTDSQGLEDQLNEQWHIMRELYEETKFNHHESIKVDSWLDTPDTIDAGVYVVYELNK